MCSQRPTYDSVHQTEDTARLRILYAPLRPPRDSLTPCFQGSVKLLMMLIAILQSIGRLATVQHIVPTPGFSFPAVPSGWDWHLLLRPEKHGVDAHAVHSFLVPDALARVA